MNWNSTVTIMLTLKIKWKIKEENFFTDINDQLNWKVSLYLS